LRTQELIRGLVADLPTPSGSVAKAISVALALSVAFSMTLMVLWLGLRPELDEAMLSAAFWMKAGYTFLIGTAGLVALERLGRPGASAAPAFAIVAVAVVSIALAGAAELMMVPAADRSTLWLGNSSLFCPWGIVALSIPVLIAGFLALRRLAPTRFALAGAAAGLMAGGYGACIYSLHCTEQTLPFLATWYTLGITLIALAGILFSRLLRW
jgi:hypothetical protein